MPRPGRMAVGVALSLAVVAGAVVGSNLRGADADGGPTLSRAAADRECAPSTSVPMRVLAPDALSLVPVAEATEPTTVALHPDARGDGFLGERSGRVLAIRAGEVTDDVALDLRAVTMQEGDGGLLALAYAPDARWLYAYRATEAHDDVLEAYPLDPRGEVDATAGRLLLHVERTDSLQHHGGGLAVTSNGLLYLGLGDGGGLGDPRENAQDTLTLLGKVLRLEPTPAEPDPYRIPADNPFVDDPDVLPEIWAIGVRNPFRIGVDAATGDLWLGDVGQSCWEELDRLPTGADSAGGSNLGWDIVEGTHPFEGGEVPGRRLDPALEHAHRDGWCGVVAGYVQRDGPLPELEGHLLYADYCHGRLVALDVDGVGPAAERVIDTRLAVENPIAIVAGPSGRPWVLTLAGQIWELVPGG